MTCEDLATRVMCERLASWCAFLMVSGVASCWDPPCDCLLDGDLAVFAVSNSTFTFPSCYLCP